MPCVWHGSALQIYHRLGQKCKHTFAPPLTPGGGDVLKSSGRTVVRPKIWGDDTVRRRKKLTLMPAIALAALSLMVALPTLSSMHLYAASAQRYTTVTVQPGDTLWSIASAHTSSAGDVQESIDRI